MVFEKNTPLTSYTVNPIVRGDEQMSSRDVKLRDKVAPGGYSVVGQVPEDRRMQNTGIHLDQHKSLMSKLIGESMQSRFH